MNRRIFITVITTLCLTGVLDSPAFAQTYHITKCSRVRW